jgi:transcriptional regulator with XRE-family HTH domain
MGKSAEDRELTIRICGWIAYEQQRRGISQNEMGRRLGLTSGDFSRYMKGARIPACGFVLRAARVLTEVTTAQLLFESPPESRTTEAAEPPSPPWGASGRPVQPRKRMAPGAK